MKIIGNTENGHIVAMTREEAAAAAGYDSMSSVPDKMTTGDGWRKTFTVGTEIRFTDATVKMRQIAVHEERVRQSAGLLRGLAEMLEQATPSQVIPPATHEQEAPANG